MELWKEQIHRSSYLKSYWKGRDGRVNHPVFGETPPEIVKCDICGKEVSSLDAVRSIRNGVVEYIVCKECYASKRKMGKYRKTLAAGKTAGD